MTNTNWPGDVPVFAIAAALIKEFEGFRPAPYKDSADIATIGYGTILYPDGRSVTMQDPAITEAQATQFLEHQMTHKAVFLASCLHRPATVHQAAAMLSLIYNIGTLAFQESSVLRYFNDGNIPVAADTFLLWDKATVHGQHQVVEGLLTRRERERAIFLTPG